MITYRSFVDNIPLPTLPYQAEAFDNAERFGRFEYNQDGYAFTLQKCMKFNHTYLLIRNDKALSGILTLDKNIQVRSTKDGIETAIIGESNRSSTERNSRCITSNKNYCIEYAGNIVEIEKGDRIWLDIINNKIMIGWHGSYSPPHGM